MDYILVLAILAAIEVFNVVASQAPLFIAAGVSIGFSAVSFRRALNDRRLSLQIER